ncbi:MAG: hypothetical protein HN842_03975 [Gammaproteobacteria bacterium]|jgi:hypothetical protein|nr:hypothetical protein [Gammaproteobacteria bacterium]MBT7307348.1 hypothetical protein [Gammaproteobacteria bacterium]
MEQFLERHRPFLLSTLWLVSGLLLFGYAVAYKPKEVMTDDLRTATRRVAGEVALLKEKRLRVLERQKSVQGEEKRGVNSLPDFLFRINLLAKNNQVIIRKLTVDEQDRMRFNIELLIDYFTFLLFASELESLDVNIHDMEVHPYKPGAIPPLHLITFAITPRNDAQPLSGSRIVRLGEAVAKQEKRNPFRRFAQNDRGKGESEVIPEIDLTWVYKLTGIGTDRGGRYATIDRIDYLLNDVLDGKVITAIQKDRLYLSKNSAQGEQKFVLKFRRKKSGKRGGVDGAG